MHSQKVNHYLIQQSQEKKKKKAKKPKQLILFSLVV